MPVPDAAALTVGGPDVATLISAAAARLREAGSESPRLDAELLVGHAYGRDRAWLHAHPDAALCFMARGAVGVGRQADP